MAQPYQPFTGMTPQDVASARQYGQGLMQQGTDASPVGHWTQALARALQGGVGGYEVGSANKGEREGRASGNQLLVQALQTGNFSPMMAHPWAEETGKKLAIDKYTTDRNQAFQRQQQDRQFQQQMTMQQGGQAHAERMANLQHQLSIRLAQAKDQMEVDALMQKARALGLAPPAASAQQDVMSPSPQGQPQAAPQSSAVQPQAPPDPYATLTQPPIPREQIEADTRRRAGQAIIMGDPKGAVKIMNKEEDPKEYQTKDALWAERMARSEIMMRGNIGTPDKPTYNPGRWQNQFWPDDGILANLPRPIGNSEQWRNYQAGAREWIAALLRKDTGAAVTDSEWKLYFPTYFPQPGDSPEVQKQKLERRVAEARKLRGSSGPAFDRQSPNFDAEMRQRLQEQDKVLPKPKQAPVRVTSPDEARRLPSGTPIILPDGSEGRVP